MGGDMISQGQRCRVFGRVAFLLLCISLLNFDWYSLPWWDAFGQYSKLAWGALVITNFIATLVTGCIAVFGGWRRLHTAGGQQCENVRTMVISEIVLG